MKHRILSLFELGTLNEERLIKKSALNKDKFEIIIEDLYSNKLIEINSGNYQLKNIYM